VPRLIAISLLTLLLLAGCTQLPAPRPLGVDERLICKPGSAISHRVVVPRGVALDPRFSKARGVCGR